MHELVARLNIGHYRKLLVNEVDGARRQTLLRLLAEEEAKLSEAICSRLERTG